MCELDQNEHTYFSVYFDALEYYFTKNDQKQHTLGISKRNIQVMIKRNRFLKFVWCVVVEQNDNNNKKSDSSNFY